MTSLYVVLGIVGVVLWLGALHFFFVEPKLRRRHRIHELRR